MFLFTVHIVTKRAIIKFIKLLALMLFLRCEDKKECLCSKYLVAM